MVSKLSQVFKMAEFMNNSSKIIKPETGVNITLCQLARDLVENKRLIYFGEVHGHSQVVGLEILILKILVEQAKSKDPPHTVNVFLEHFSLEHQPLIDSYLSDDIKEKELFDKYKEFGDEGHDVEKYASLLKYAKENLTSVKINGSFVPRKFAKMLVKDGEDKAYDTVVNLGYMKDEEKFPGSEDHYNFFDSLISGRSLNSDQEVSDRFKKIFPAQVLKDGVMASSIRRGIESSGLEDKFMVIAGSGHVDFRFGVPERLDRFNLIPRSQTCIITVRDGAEVEFTENQEFGKVEKFENSYPGDYVFLYDEDKEEVEEDGEIVKSEISAAYDKIATTAQISGDAILAEKVMTRLGYTKYQIDVAGRDAYNYQGVGCPHGHAAIIEGESVLDIGSGLGVDSFIAGAAVGDSGLVTGLDISKGEVGHAIKRAAARSVTNVKFVHGDMEKMPFETESFDAVISNGAFCLAPNKEAAFEEIFRVLKPGGRFSVACTTVKEDLDKEINWPICMRVFMPLDHAVPMLNRVGFGNVGVDDSDSKMTLDDIDDGIEFHEENTQGGTETVDQNGRKKIHVGSSEFDHLENYDMNQLCARVVLYGVK
eukprot:GFUD01001290.1.p1 GENE.GFUD01001290.1~~GFUD01001290.1.p1  ORF type:complete len:595 (+),score=168.40 GFUD01001290.1:46-1830(+)